MWSLNSSRMSQVVQQETNIPQLAPWCGKMQCPTGGQELSGWACANRWSMPRRYSGSFLSALSLHVTLCLRTLSLVTPASFYSLKTMGQVACKWWLYMVHRCECALYDSLVKNWWSFQHVPGHHPMSWDGPQHSFDAEHRISCRWVDGLCQLASLGMSGTSIPSRKTAAKWSLYLFHLSVVLM